MKIPTVSNLCFKGFHEMDPVEFSLEQIQVGHRFAPLHYPVSDELVIKYAQAVDDLNPLYSDPELSLSGPFGGKIAPPTLAGLFALKAYRTGSMPPPRGIQRSQGFKFYGPIRPGDSITVQATLAEKARKEAGWLLTFRSHAKNQKGLAVVSSTSTSEWKERQSRVNPAAHTQGHALQRRQGPTPSNSILSGSEQVWEIGSPLPTVVKEITEERISQYEEILGIGNPIHCDGTYARNTPFKGIIAHGLISAAYVSESMMKVFPWEWVHGGEMEIRFLLPARPGDMIWTQGKVERKETSVRGTCFIFEVQCKNQRGEIVVSGTTRIVVQGISK